MLDGYYEIMLFAEREAGTGTKARELVDLLNGCIADLIERAGGRKRVKKLFISQPMRGKTDEQIAAEREAAITAARLTLGEDVEVLDSFFRRAPADAKPLWFLGESLKLLADADVACFAPGWKDARGCVIEHACTLHYGIRHIEL